MIHFPEAYKALNAAQKLAVDTIEGPVLVVAGPGTGKTQLLSMRAANIVRKTDTLPSNILCLTFTESAALAMRQRLINLMGPEGNKVAVHTFHSFGAEIINRYPEYFYNGARFAPADQLTTYEILQEILQDLPHSNPLAKTMNGEFTALKDAQAAISHLKRAGLLPDELRTILDHNQEFCDLAEDALGEVFSARLSKKDFPKLQSIVTDLQVVVGEPLPISFTKPLQEVCVNELTNALDEATVTGKTTTVTAWRNRWCEKNHLGNFVFKDRSRTKKLRALATIYQKYRDALIERQLFDFDDMVSLVAHTLETTDELRLNLQEQYLYVMVDEFQDTNGAQLRLLDALTDNPINEGRPNILAVGDDDQAIYAFQGAELSNILGFKDRYRDTAVITLTENYRSTAPILQQSRAVITQGTDRLESTLKAVNKELHANSKAASIAPELHQFNNPDAQYQWIADSIADRLQKGQQASDIAVIARNHRQLVQLLPYLHAAGVHVNYERRSNVLESAHIRELITLSEVIVHLAEQRFDYAEELLPELLSYEFWGLKTDDLWQLSLRAYKQRRMWLEIMLEDKGKLHAIGEFLIISAHKSLHQPLETMLDLLIGSNENQVANDDTTDILNGVGDGPTEDFVSPYRAFYFNQQRLSDNPVEYLTLLSNLRTIRHQLHSYRPTSILGLRSFIDFVDLHQRTNTPIVDTSEHLDDTDSVQLMTAHRAKGLEFNTVFVISTQDDIWGRKARHPHSSISFPHNLPIEPAGQHYDDSLRLFFVAMTRAKQHLIMTSFANDHMGRESILAEFLQAETTPQIHDDQAKPTAKQQTLAWQHRHITMPHVSQKTLLTPSLKDYSLSATHLNNFIDITRGGPQAFLLQNLLRFPQAMTSQQVFGHAIHAVLQRAHTHLTATDERRPVEDILHDYEIQLQQARLGEREFSYLLEKGSDVLQTYLAAHYQSFTPLQKAERNFAAQHVTLDGVRLTGAIDLMEVDDQAKTVTVIDYKTGKSMSSWNGKTDFDKIKLHKYKQQLMLYKLLVENSRDFAGYTVQKGVLDFVEADTDGRLHQLELTFNADELSRFQTLLQAVWRCIMELDFPDTSDHDQTFKGVTRFEDELL